MARGQIGPPSLVGGTIVGIGGLERDNECGYRIEQRDVFRRSF